MWFIDYKNIFGFKQTFKSNEKHADAAYQDWLKKHKNCELLRLYPKK